MATLADPPTRQQHLQGNRLLRAQDVALRLDISLGAVYEAARQNRIGGLVRVGRRVRFDPERFEAWIAQGGEALPGGWRRGNRPLP